MLRIDEIQEIFNADCRFNALSLREYKEAKKYYHGDQLPPEVLSVLGERGQPPIYENLYKMIINKILGYKIQNIQEIKVSGRQEEDKHLSNLLQDLVRVFSQSKNYDKEITKRDLELIFGLSVVELWVSENEKNTQVTIKTLPTESFIIDKYSTDLNANDARRFHKVLNLDAAYAKELFKNKVIITKNTTTDSRVSVIESWFLEKEGWNRYIWQNEGNICSYEVTPFKNKSHPFIIAKFAIDHDGKWYGLFRDIKPLQDYINFAENKVSNMLGSFKAFFEESAVLDAQEFSQNASIDNAIVKVSDGALKENKIHFVQHHADIAALSQKINETRNVLKIISGLNDESLGMAINRQSGVAISQRREIGLMGLNMYVKIGDDMDRLIFEKALDLIQHYFTKEQTFRIVDKKVGERYFSINGNERDKIQIGKFDLILNVTPKMSGREERFAHWSELLKTIASVRPDIVPDLLPLMLKDTDSPIVAEIEEVLALKEQSAQEQAQAQAPLQEQMQGLEMQEKQANIAQKQAQAQKYAAQSLVASTQAQSLNAQNLGARDVNPAQSGMPNVAKQTRDFKNDSVKK
ncbi:portal protein [Helicobacter sp. MIT 00-7814]|uniref:portal protein n=1 Tax=unclassified Helicobacter TaxID=2593540 RepID=UPI000E1F1AB3|nr:MULTISPECIES: portal protein [unclassified Helicobacter]RDU57106.1 portal protein [Helicobacter sp. MIT 00-7814]RDU57657.1 portal protein [Helicobacter sp. MIT 99-10781]